MFWYSASIDGDAGRAVSFRAAFVMVLVGVQGPFASSIAYAWRVVNVQ